jgi:Transposase C of IS166 homeodomain
LRVCEEQLGAASKQLDTTRSELQYARLKIQVLEEHLRLRRIAKYGPGSEQLSNLQLEMLEQEPGVCRQEVAAESEREPLPAVGDEKKRERRRHPGRQTLPADLPRVEKVIACTPEQCGHLACCNALIPPLPRSATASQAVQLAKLGLCPKAVPLIVATQCHNPGAMSVLINNSATTCSELAKH